MELKDLPGSDAWIYLATTGAGAGAQDILWSVPGASAFLAGASLPYSAHELSGFLGYPPPQSVSERVASEMALASYMRACASCPPGRVPVGVGCTASVATLQDHRGAHRSWTAVISGHNRVLVESQIYEKVGPKGRVADGGMVDFQIISMIERVLGGESGYDNSGIWVLFSDRPLFRPDGSRGADAPICSTLMPGAFDPLHCGHLYAATPGTIFQISLRTPHKPEISVTDALRRVAKINAAGYRALIEDEASTFLVKARRWPMSTFIIGSDTLERILDPKYGHPIDDMVTEFDDLNTSFKVSWRKGTRSMDSILDDAGIAPPERHMFEQLPLSPYADLSSTQLRERVE